MVGIVVVSHSRKAAEGIAEIADEMGGEGSVNAVGGTEDGRVGTTPDPIREAIEAAGSDGDGVVVVVDLGSAVMNAELAIEMAEVDGEVVMADAPVLEGALNAAVTATSASASVESVKQAAEDARDVSKL
ncbi:dihydroxyacetone kinase phosphoryl donor subunit DhaM [Salinilacihabitans rarus]|uniref:dihydroxyacetone kinase phosphoryl donor subunit DhaM n=1 Tax=Salinilacihabitans rarus TaxID=2961596 RepID=UPI0020C86D04|nr:dihydroxyacetone kinase phosphoryl donor subunit DhaM [Salinilacihabitans rarus]